MADEPANKDRTGPAPGDSGTAQGRKPAPNIKTLAGTGVELAGAVAVLSLVGWWLDGKFGTSPVFLLIGAFMGIVGGMYKLWRVGKQFFDH